MFGMRHFGCLALGLIFMSGHVHSAGAASKAKPTCSALLQQMSDTHRKLAADMPDEAKELAKYCAWGRATYLPTLKRLVSVWEMNMSVTCGAVTPADLLNVEKRGLERAQKSVDAACVKAGTP